MKILLEGFLKTLMVNTLLFKTEYEILLESLTIKILSEEDSNKIFKEIYKDFPNNSKQLVESSLELKETILDN